MPIYEYACPKCRKIFSFLARRLKATRKPACPQCGSKKLEKEVSRFAPLKGTSETGGDDAPDFDAPRMDRVMREMEKDMAHLDENNPKHMAHMMRKMQKALPDDMMPKEMNDAIRRLESGEDPDKIEEDMGEIFDQFMGPDESGSPSGSSASYTRDSGLYDL